MFGPASEIKSATCSQCQAVFYFDSDLWDPPPTVCTIHRGPTVDASRSRPNRSRHKGTTPDATAEAEDHQSVGSPLQVFSKIRRPKLAITPFLDQICDGVCNEPQKVHLILTSHHSGKSTALPFALLDTQELTDYGAIVIVVPSHSKLAHYAPRLGQKYYGIYNSDSRPDLTTPVCGPYFAVGYRAGSEDQSSERNFAWYSTRGRFLQALEENCLGPCRCVVLMQSSDESRDDKHNFISLLDASLVYRKAHPEMTIIIGTGIENEEELVTLLGGEANVKLYRIPPLVRRWRRLLAEQAESQQ